MRPRAHYSDYTPPATDSPRAKAQAVLFLVGARSLDRVTVEWFAHQYRLKPATAADLLARAREQRT